MFKNQLKIGLLFTLFNSSINCYLAAQKVCSTNEHLSLTEHCGSDGIQRHFSCLYAHTNEILDQNLSKKSLETSQFAADFSGNFAAYFLKAADSFNFHHAIPKAWEVYFADSQRSVFTFWMLGVNAHICGDMPLALSDKYTLQELRKYRSNFKQMNSAFYVLIKEKIQEGIAMDNSIAKWHRRSLGLDYIIAKHNIRKWRRQSFHLAVLLEKGRPDATRKIYRKWKRHNKKCIRLSRFLGISGEI